MLHLVGCLGLTYLISIVPSSTLCRVPRFRTYCWSEGGLVHSPFAGYGFSLLCPLSFLLHLAFCLSTYSANLHLLTLGLPCLLRLPVVLLLILGLFVLKFLMFVPSLFPCRARLWL